MALLLPPEPSPWSARRSLVLDVALTGALLVGVVFMVVNAYDRASIVLSTLQILPLAVRRLRPTTSFLLVSGFMALQVLVVDNPLWGQVAMPVAVYSVVAYGPRSRAAVAVGVALLAGVVGPLSWLPTFDTAPGVVLTRLLVLVVVTELLVIAPWAMGSLTRTRAAYVAQLIDRGHRLEVEAAQRAELAASDERARIAREMHDVIAHGLTVMIVQADGARYAVEKDPASAARALGTISTTGRESLAEMRRMLGLLRSEDGTGTRPQPGLADLPHLLEESRAAGMHLEVDLADPLPAVGPGTALTVYRVVQEGLTNARKHAGPQATVRVAIRREAGSRLLVSVADDGRGPAGPADERGHGLDGMRERVAVHGGALRCGPRPGGGFLLEAELPLDGEQR